MEHFETMTAPILLPSTPKPSEIQRDLRFVLTQKCNYQCSFCHKEGCDGSEKELLDSEDYDFLFSTAKDVLGIQQVTLSGGEPMMRKDISTISKTLHDSGAKITMVSNGALVSKQPEVMQYIDTLNLSLHTTDQQLYKNLTGSSTDILQLIQEIATIHERYPHLRVKLNSAIINDQNTPDTEDFAHKIHLASQYGWKLKYLELSDADTPGFVKKETFEKQLEKNGFVRNNKTTRQHIYTKDGVEVITGKVFCSEAKQTQDPQGYCKKYNDIYITPDGYLSTCPVNIKKISAYEAIISKNTSALSQLFQKALDKNTHYSCPFSS